MNKLTSNCIFLFALCISTSLTANAKEFNYDTHQTWKKFNWKKNKCDQIYSDLIFLNDTYPSGPKNVLEGRTIVASLNKFTRSGCKCNAYVALRLEKEGYSSAKSGGEILNFSKSKRLYKLAGKMARKTESRGLDLDRGATGPRAVYGNSLHTTIFKTKGISGLVSPMGGGQCTSAWGDPETKPPIEYSTVTYKSNNPSKVSGFGFGTDWNYDPNKPSTRTTKINEIYSVRRKYTVQSATR